jgi:hypothetical protein
MLAHGVLGIETIRPCDVSFRVPQGVAIQASKEGLTDTFDTSEIDMKIRTKMWSPAYANLLDRVA